MDLKTLCRQYQLAKENEQLAKEGRLEAEKALLDAIRLEKQEGTETFATEGFKIKVTSKLNRSLDFPAYQALDLGDNLAFVTLKPEIDLKRLRAIEMVDPAIVASCVTVKPAKPSIKVEEVMA